MKKIFLFTAILLLIVFIAGVVMFTGFIYHGFVGFTGNKSGFEIDTPRSVQNESSIPTSLIKAIMINKTRDKYLVATEKGLFFVFQPEMKKKIFNILNERAGGDILDILDDPDYQQDISKIDLGDGKILYSGQGEIFDHLVKYGSAINIYVGENDNEVLSINYTL